MNEKNYKKDDSPIGEKIRFFMAKNGISQSDFYRKTGFDNRRLSRYFQIIKEKPDTEPPFDLVRCLRTAYGVDVNELIDGGVPIEMMQEADGVYNAKQVKEFDRLLLKLIEEQQKGNREIMDFINNYKE